MTAILDWLLTTVIALPFGLATSPAELIGFVTNGAAVYLVAKNNIWTWPVGIVGAAFFFILFLEARLYTDMWLQVFFVASCLYGWAMWLWGGEDRTRLNVRRINWQVTSVAVVGILAFVILMVPVLREAHGSYPIPDATTTGFSVAAQLIMGLKMIENWGLWIAADIIYIPVYALKGLYFTSFLYVIFLGLCFKGVHYWWSVYKQQQAVEEETPIGLYPEGHVVPPQGQMVAAGGD